MGKFKRGGYIFIDWIGDHSPRHVHIYKGAKLIAKFDLEKWQPMQGRINRKVMQYLVEFRKDGKL